MDVDPLVGGGLLGEAAAAEAAATGTEPVWIQVVAPTGYTRVWDATGAETHPRMLTIWELEALHSEAHPPAEAAAAEAAEAAATGTEPVWIQVVAPTGYTRQAMNRYCNARQRAMDLPSMGIHEDCGLCWACNETQSRNDPRVILARNEIQSQHPRRQQQPMEQQEASHDALCKVCRIPTSHPLCYGGNCGECCTREGGECCLPKLEPN